MATLLTIIIVIMITIVIVSTIIGITIGTYNHINNDTLIYMFTIITSSIVLIFILHFTEKTIFIVATIYMIILILINFIINIISTFIVIT